MNSLSSQNIILFDGVCNLCNNSVNFIIDRDKENFFQFASLQSEFGQKLQQENSEKIPANIDSIILYENGSVFTKSSAALRIAKKLSGGWKFLYALIIIPSFIRNFFYDVIAKNRYRWFGKEESCRIPTPELKSKFLG